MSKSTKPKGKYENPVLDKFAPKVLKTPELQYEKCMSDNPLTLQNKRRKDLTLEELAEYRCKPIACKL
jgi:hypothetical protein